VDFAEIWTIKTWFHKPVIFTQTSTRYAVFRFALVDKPIFGLCVLGQFALLYCAIKFSKRPLSFSPKSADLDFFVGILLFSISLPTIASTRSEAWQCLLIFFMTQTASASKFLLYLNFSFAFLRPFKMKSRETATINSREAFIPSELDWFSTYHLF